MGINLLRRRVLVERDETVQEILARKIVVVATRVVREIVTERRVWEFFCEQVDLV